MCGINGFISTSPYRGSAYPDLLEAMNVKLRHRGPDDHGIWSHPNDTIHFAHQRLSIIDLSNGGHQPMSDEDGNCIVFNGEIYNYLELRRKYGEHTFRTASDTEVLLWLLKTKGTDCLSELNGMFAFAWWNEKTAKLLLVRDRLGKKPLYYSRSGNRFSFSSEIAPLLSLPWNQSELNRESLIQFLSFNQLSAPLTMFEGIVKLNPGSFLQVNSNGSFDGEFEPGGKSYWLPNWNEGLITNEGEAVEELIHLLSSSVQLRMIADVPVGAFLSGGVDSSSIVALMRQQTDGPIHTFSVGFEQEDAYDERIWAERIARKYNTEHHEITIEADDIKEGLPLMASIFDEPLADPTSIPIHYICRAAKQQNIKVILSGDGADELFAGYRNWQDYIKNASAYQLLLNSPPSALRILAKLGTNKESHTRFAEMMERAARREVFYQGGKKAFRPYHLQNYLQLDWLNPDPVHTTYRPLQNLRAEFETLYTGSSGGKELSWMCHTGIRMQLPNKYLHRMDRLGMHQGLEVRCPYLDYRLVNFSLTLSAALKVKNKIPKYILKKSLEKILPNEILYRKKMGFCVPIREWGDDIMTQYIRSNLRNFCSNTGIFREERILSDLKALENGSSEPANRMWTVYFLMNWMNRWM